MRSTKLQCTVTGHTSWALVMLARRKGKTQAEIASGLLDEFFDDHPEYLEKHGITFEQFGIADQGGEVVPMNARKVDDTGGG